jgi:putative nucleotidyltransferase with HDIG domain
MARPQGACFQSHQEPDRIEKQTSMLVHIAADHPNKISDLRPLFGSQHVITSALLHGKDRLPKDCDAIVAAADLRNAENIAALKTVSTAFKSARRKIFVVDQKARLDAAQAYALGATHVLFNPVYRQSLLAALSDSGKPQEFAGDADRVAREAASEGAACLDSMFSRVLTGQQVDVAEVKHAASRIADAVGESGFSHWMETVRLHHEGTYQHCLLVTGTAAAFGLSLGLARADLERLYTAAMFHDVGKAKIPSAVLDKPGRLDDQERALIETHSAVGYDALKGAGAGYPRKSWTRSGTTTNILTAAAIPIASVPRR